MGISRHYQDVADEADDVITGAAQDDVTCEDEVHDDSQLEEDRLVEAFLAEQFAELDACRDRLHQEEEVDDDDDDERGSAREGVSEEENRAWWEERTRMYFPEGTGHLTEDEVILAVAEAAYAGVLEMAKVTKNVSGF